MKLLGCLYYSSSTDPVSIFLGIILIFLIGFFCCYSSGDDKSGSKTSYRPGNYNGGYMGDNENHNSSYLYDDEENYNWDDSWDDKWLHQGKYADDNHHEEEYTDYDPSWDEHFRH